MESEHRPASSSPAGESSGSDRRRSRLATRCFALPPWAATTAGALAGGGVGWVIAASMRQRQFFTQAYQPELVSAILIALWVLIGIIGGLTVLAPEETMNDE